MLVVTTPTGKIGRHVVQNLLDAGETVRVIVRDPAKLAATVRDRVEVVEGSHADASVVTRAFDGAEAVFWLVAPDPASMAEHAYVEFARPAAEALRRCGVARVVAVSALGRGTPWQDRAGLVTGALQMVDVLRESGAAVRGLALPAFMETALQQVDAIRAGQMFGPVDADRKVPHTATRDSAAAAARLLADRSWTGQQDVAVLGPEELSYADLAAIMSDVLGRAVRYQQVPFEASKAQLLEHGMSEAFAQGYIDMMRAKNEGMDEVRRSDAIIGPTTFRKWAEEALKPAVLG